MTTNIIETSFGETFLLCDQNLAREKSIAQRQINVLRNKILLKRNQNGSDINYCLKVN